MQPMRRRAAVVIVSVIVLVGGLVARPFVRGLSFVVRAADMHGVARRLASIGTYAESEREIVIDGPGGVIRGHVPIPGRLYLPDATPRRFTLLVSGLHAAGIDEPRLVAIARQIAASGVAVVTPAIPELQLFNITSQITDDIEAAALWTSTKFAVAAGDGRIGLVGISFSGGLSIVAAGRPSLGGKIAYVLSLGGHDDLPRVLRYLCTGVEPPLPRSVRLPGADTSRVRPPHDYGAAVILLGVADKLVPKAQTAMLQSAVRRFLYASYLDGVDKARAEREFVSLRDLADTLPEPSATLLKYVNARDVAHLGARLLPYIAAYGGDPALSVSRSPKPSAPVFLLHGADDNVIPSIESEYLAEDLRGHAPVRLLLSDLISHAGVNHTPRAVDVITLAGFWGDLLGR